MPTDVAEQWAEDGTASRWRSSAIAASAGYTTLGYHATKPTYLARLAGTMSVAGTVGVYYADDAAGTNEAVLIAPQPVGANGGPHEVHEDDLAMMPFAPAGKYLLLKTTAGTFSGRSVTGN